jgi:hypothetical protein
MIRFDQDLRHVVYDPALNEDEKNHLISELAKKMAEWVSSNVKTAYSNEYLTKIEKEVSIANKAVWDQNWDQKFTSYTNQLQNVGDTTMLSTDQKLAKLLEITREFSYSVANTRLNKEDKEVLYRAIENKYNEVKAKIIKS